MTKAIALLLVTCVTIGCGGHDVSSDVDKSKSASREFRALLDQSMEELRMKTSGHDATWNISEASWSVDQDVGNVVFATPRGLTVTAPVQIIGTYNTDDGTWLWAWDNPSIEGSLQESSLKVKQYGEQKGIAALTTRRIWCTEEEAWELAALACNLCEAQGAYRGPADATRIFMTFGNVKISK